MITVFIQLTSAGADAGPFKIYSDGETPAFSVELASVSKAALFAGINVNVEDDTTVIRVVSTGTCDNYQDIIIDTPPTTTTTTTPTPITPATVNVTNDSIDIVVSNVVVNANNLVGATFPVDPAENTSGTTTQTGTQSITVLVIGTSTSQSIRVTDSAGNYSCKDFIGNGAYQFFGQTVNSSQAVEVLISSSPCSVAPSTTTTSTTAPPPVSKIVKLGATGWPAICSQATSTVYFAVELVVGAIMYTDNTLTTPVTGFTIMSDTSGDGSTYNLDTLTGEILSAEGNTCP